MDFVEVRTKIKTSGHDKTTIVYPEFQVTRSKDLLVKGGKFYAIWDDRINLWSTDILAAKELIDDELINYADHIRTLEPVSVMTVSGYSSNKWEEFNRYMKNLPSSSVELDSKLIFSNDTITRKDYASKKLSYAIGPGKIDAYEEIISTLYDPEEREKIEWCIGSIINGDSKKLQKFAVLYGDAGTGKSTILNLIEKMFEGYCATFDAKSLGQSSNQFATEQFKSNPLVAIQHDGDLSKIEDNTRLNSIVSHEAILINEKYKSAYPTKLHSFLFMATNKPVKITDAKSGILRRLIDITPTGNKIPATRYYNLVNQMSFELGAIADHCLRVYNERGKNYYDNYIPMEMVGETDVFYNFVEDSFDVFKEQDGCTLKQAFDMYKQYCDEAMLEYRMPKYKFKAELKNYFRHFDDRTRVSDVQVRNYYSGFRSDKFGITHRKTPEKPVIFSMDETTSLLDDILADCPAQYANDSGSPMYKWDNVKTTLKDLDTTKLHYVIPPSNMIVIDFDIKDENGEKCYEKNLEAASTFPPTYAETSRSGGGVHLHYYWDGDIGDLSPLYGPDIEIKVFKGHSALRRCVNNCNNLGVARIGSGLPLKKEGEAKMVNFTSVKNEKAIRTMIKKNLNKEYLGYTKPSIDFIFKILDQAYKSGIPYDVTDMRDDVFAFAASSTNQSKACIKMVCDMHFKSENVSEPSEFENESLIFYDVEVFPNLFVVVWKADGLDECIKMINPTPEQIENLVKMKLIGFNCRRYDNHILYARMLGYTNEQLYNLSQNIINGKPDCFFGEAYNISYTDVYDFCATKQSLKKWEIQLDIHHQELGLPWDQPVDESMWDTVADYCCNDVIATEATFHANEGDFIAREILADLADMTVNDTTNSLTTKIIFGNNRKPQSEFNYVHLADIFKGYKFDHGVSTYRGEEVGEGGYVYAEPGMYGNVALLDIASMHPSSIIAMNMFGPYTDSFKKLLDARLAIKHKDFKKVTEIIPEFERYLSNEEEANKNAKALTKALKIAINSVYGLTAAKFDNPFRDPRNIDNIVAKRGALFMVDLKHAVQEKGYTVAHIKTDSIKIPDADEEIISFVKEFGEKYGYTFEHEDTYNKFALVNDAVYIAKTEGGKWTATGTQFQVPYVFKSLFTHEPIEFKDTCETKSVSKGLLYLDMNEGRDEEHDYRFIGKVGSFCPIKPGCGGGTLYRKDDAGKYSAPPGTKGWRWLESEQVRLLNREDDIDDSYYKILVENAATALDELGDYNWFVSDAKYDGEVPFRGGKIFPMNPPEKGEDNG